MTATGYQLVIERLRLRAENASTKQRILSGFLNAFFFKVMKNYIRHLFLIIFFTTAMRSS
jgi:hypothetical protein